MNYFTKLNLLTPNLSESADTQVKSTPCIWTQKSQQVFRNIYKQNFFKFLNTIASIPVKAAKREGVKNKSKNRNRKLFLDIFIA